MKKNIILSAALLLIAVAAFFVLYPHTKESITDTPVKQPQNTAELTQNKKMAKPAFDSAKTKQNISGSKNIKNYGIQPDEKEMELEYQLAQEFEAEALEVFPVHTVQTFNPYDPDAFGPPKGEVWVRIKAENAREYKDIMAQISDLFTTVTYYSEPVTIMNWVGGRPQAKQTYPSEEE